MNWIFLNSSPSVCCVTVSTLGGYKLSNLFRMGNGGSVQPIPPELFLALKAEYEKKKEMNLSDDDLYAQMKASFDALVAAQQKATVSGEIGDHPVEGITVAPVENPIS